MPKDNQKMTEREVFQLAEAADLLADYGYENEADLIARISENEQILLYSGGSLEQRQPATIITLRQLQDAATKLAAGGIKHVEYNRAQAELIAAVTK